MGFLGWHYIVVLVGDLSIVNEIFCLVYFIYFSCRNLVDSLVPLTKRCDMLCAFYRQ